MLFLCFGMPSSAIRQNHCRSSVHCVLHNTPLFSLPRLFLISIATIPLLLLPCVDFASAVSEDETALPWTHQKRGGARVFSALASVDAFPPPNEKRSGGRAFGGGIQTINDGFDANLAGELKRAGGRLFRMSALSSAGGDPFVPEGKRGGARPFYGGGYIDGAWKRAGGRYFLRQFDDSPFGSGWMSKRGGGRSFFGGADGLYNSANYWAPQRLLLPINKHPRRSLLGDSLEFGDDDPTAQPMPMGPSPPYFFTNNHNFDGRANGKKRGGARAFIGEKGALENSVNLEKRGGGRNFNEMGDTEEHKEKRRFGEQISSL